MLYHAYELGHAAIAPMRAAMRASRYSLLHPSNPMRFTPFAHTATAAIDVLDGLTRRYDKPEFGLDSVTIDGRKVPVEEQIVYRKPFGQLKYFARQFKNRTQRDDPKLLIVAPMSGHYATLLRGTVAAMLPDHEVYITDWRDARMAPVSEGHFDLDDYIDYIIEFLRVIGADTHVLAVCQPGVPVLMAVALMAAEDNPYQPPTMTLMGSPIDARQSPTEPNVLATERPLSWFEHNLITHVPLPNPGFMRRVYPGFLQLSGFMSMNLDRHLNAHRELFASLVRGDGDSAEAHRTFYDEYLSVMDLTAEFYLMTVSEVFQKFSLAKGEATHRGRPVRPDKITKTALMTVEGELDDISGIGQTQAAHELCKNIPPEKQLDYIQKGVGHYGVFNGSRWRTEISPRIKDFIRTFPVAS
ncbi:MAG TPA: polyhydroxyalkanoate depolymerase [Alphaproteobacteria bacterium]|nr:polyhydroxyalkanoate depolymerase [Alphaproteobacteria bacterium]HCO90399.1 polyhydroxyalkanoate depolymerase [Alphaproteobacteria bacterium]